jgi:thiamine pyrophosphate-dependent acetolactate synthase large subunit-like protein
MGREKGRDTRRKEMKKTGAEVLWESLIREGVDVMFGIPGGAVIPAFDAMLNYPKLRFILTRHEEGAAIMADGYARASRKVGVAIATSGPGATNLVTGIHIAFMDSSPVVFITGQVASNLLGSDAFQEVDMTGITLPITKHNFLITSPDEVAQTVHEAFYIARSGRPGPVLIDFCKDAQVAKTENVEPPDVRLLGYHPPMHAAAEGGAEVRRADPHPGGDDPPEPGIGPFLPSAFAGNDGYARRSVLQLGDPAIRPDHRAGDAVRRPGDR